jgi:hypothetical protein
MKEHQELLVLVDELEQHVIAQDRKIRAALAALQTGKAVDVFAAIEILKGEK